MAKERLSDAAVDQILERFDRTAPELRRRIIVTFVRRAVVAEGRVGLLLAALKRFREAGWQARVGTAAGDEVINEALAAIWAAETGEV